jgi:hypothetical protein
MTDEQRRWLIVIIAAGVGAIIGFLANYWLG